MDSKQTVPADENGVALVVQLVEAQLKEYGVKGRERMKAVLAAEEAAGCLADHAAPGETMTVCLRTLLGSMAIELAAKGDRFVLSESMRTASLLDDALEEGARDMLRGILLNSVADGLKYKHSHDTNRIRMTVLRSKRAFLYHTLGAMLLAVVVGLALAGLGFAQFNTAADTYFLIPVKTMYMNALEMVAAPVVFFSIVSCIMSFSNVSELGRIGVRILLLYLLTTVIAVLVGIGAYYLFRPGSAVASAEAAHAAQKITSQTMNVSLKELIVGVVPQNLVQPFLSSDMLQLIFLAVVCGIAAGQIGRYSEMVKDIFEAFNELFLKITTMIIRFMPLAVFCSICSMMINTGAGTLLALLGMFGTFLFGIVCMILVYCLLLVFLGKLNPLPFLKSYAPTMMQVFSMASSNAAIPLNLDACKKMGVPQKIYSLSIPLGATLNMDGGCIYMAVFAFALAGVYGVELTGASVMGLIISIIVLSMGAPGIAGSGLICLSVLLAQVGVPTEAIGLIMGVDALIGMFRCMNNCTGDAAISVIVAQKEASLDIEQYDGHRKAAEK